jgi:ATP-dependent helicase/nuclease subunit A
VLDYKLQHDPAQVAVYREQLAGYVQAVRALQPGDAVSGAFITAQGEVIEA